jgi:hypothetical protein
MKTYQKEYINRWLPKPSSFRFLGFPGQLYTKDIEDIYNLTTLNIGDWIQGMFIKAPVGENYTKLELVKRKVEDYFVTMPYFECSIAKYGTTQQPRKAYGKTECLIWDLDNVDIEKSYNDMQKLTKYIKDQTGEFPAVHYSGKQGFHIFIYLPYPVNDIYNKGVYYTLKLITEKAGVTVPSQDETNRSANSYEKPDKIEPEDKYWTVDPAVWGDITKSRMIRIPFTPRSNGNYCWPINPTEPLENIWDYPENVKHSKLVWNDLVTAIINNQRIISTVNANKQQKTLNKKVHFKKKQGDKYKDFGEIDCRTVWNDLFSIEVNNSDHYRAFCPHCNAGAERKQPSLRIFKDGYFCHACKMGGNAYGIAMLKFNDKEKVIEYLRGV